MHEATIAQSILDIATKRFSETPEAESVSTIKIMLGEFRNIDWQSLQFAFDNLKSNYNCCKDSELQAQFIMTSAECCQCGDVYHPDIAEAFRCTKCGGGIGKLISGEELDIVSIILEANTKDENNYARVG